MEILKQIHKKYRELRMQGYNDREAAKDSVNEVLSHKVIKPFIYTDGEGFPTHIFYDNHVLFFDGDIYKSIHK